MPENISWTRVTHHSYMPLYSLYPSIGFRYQKFGMNKLLYGEHNSVLHSQADGGSTIRVIVRVRSFIDKSGIPGVLDSFIRVLDLQESINT